MIPTLMSVYLLIKRELWVKGPRCSFFYACLTIHAVAGDRPAVHRPLNRAPLFWNTNLGVPLNCC